METITGVIIEDSTFRYMCDSISAKQLRASFSSAMRKSAMTIRKGVQREVRSLYKHRNRNYEPLANDVKVMVWKRDVGANVNLYDARKKGGRAYVLRFLNDGTGKNGTPRRAYTRMTPPTPLRRRKAYRYTYNRGNVEGSKFFLRGVNATIGIAQRDLEANVVSAVIKKASGIKI